MPEFTYSDRLLLDLETRLWVAWQIFDEIPDCSWSDEVKAVRKEISRIAGDIRDYHDGWEVPE